jgi:hypothetical protein
MFLLDEKMKVFRAYDKTPIMFDALIAFLDIACFMSEGDAHIRAFLEDYMVVRRWNESQIWQVYGLYDSRVKQEKPSADTKALPHESREFLELARETSSIQDVARDPIRILWLADSDKSCYSHYVGARSHTMVRKLRGMQLCNRRVKGEPAEFSPR